VLQGVTGGVEVQWEWGLRYFNEPNITGGCPAPTAQSGAPRSQSGGLAAQQRLVHDGPATTVGEHIGVLSSEPRGRGGRLGLPLSCTASSLQACAKLVQAQQARYIVDDSGISPPLSCAPWPCPCLHPAQARTRQVAWASHRSQPPKQGNQAGMRWALAVAQGIL